MSSGSRHGKTRTREKLEIYNEDGTLWGRFRRMPTGNWLPVGAHPLNTGGKPGRSGAKRNSFKTMCREILSSPHLKQKLLEIARDGNHRDVLALSKFTAEYTQSKPAQKLNVRTTPLEDLVAGSHDSQEIANRA